MTSILFESQFSGRAIVLLIFLLWSALNSSLGDVLTTSAICGSLYPNLQDHSIADRDEFLHANLMGGAVERIFYVYSCDYRLLVHIKIVISRTYHHCVIAGSTLVTDACDQWPAQRKRL